MKKSKALVLLVLTAISAIFAINGCAKKTTTPAQTEIIGSTS